MSSIQIRPVAAALAALLLVAASIRAQTPDDGRPRGIYSMGPALDHAFVEGGVRSFPWNSIEIAPGVFDFTAVDAAIAQAEALGKRMTMINFVRDVPADLLADPAVVKWTHPQWGTQPVPWDPIALARWTAYCQALADHPLPSAAQGGALLPLRLHPTLTQVSSPVLGLQGFRIIGGSATDMTGYTRAAFTAGFLASIHAMRDQFGAKYAYTGVFPMNDGNNAPTLTDHVRATLLAEFDGVSHPLLGFFQENWSAHRAQPGGTLEMWPDPTATQGLNDLLAMPFTYVMFQAAQGWNCPFTNPANVANATVVDGLAVANSIYACTYFEVYACDLNDASLHPALEQLAAQLRARPHQENHGAATLLVDGRTGFAPLTAGANVQLEVLGAPGAACQILLGAPLEPAGTPYGSGLLDLGRGHVRVLARGVLSAQGTFSVGIPAPSTSWSGLAVQAVVRTSAGAIELSGRTKF